MIVFAGCISVCDSMRRGHSRSRRYYSITKAVTAQEILTSVAERPNLRKGNLARLAPLRGRSLRDSRTDVLAECHSNCREVWGSYSVGSRICGYRIENGHEILSPGCEEKLVATEKEFGRCSTRLCISFALRFWALAFRRHRSNASGAHCNPRVLETFVKCLQQKLGKYP